MFNIVGKSAARPPLTLVLALLIAVAGVQVDAESVGAVTGDELELFCYPELHKNTRQSCECSSESSSPWGLRAIQIDCSYKDYKTQDISTLLPLYVDTLDLSWNMLDSAPVFASSSLHLLNMAHNNISSIAAKNFKDVGNLRELYLGWNSIQVLAAQAFENLPHLQVLDLSHNNLRTLPLQVFAPLIVLETLSLSWNQRLNHTAGDAAALNVYAAYGVRQDLHTLKLEACGLVDVVIPQTAALRELYLRRNQLSRVPANLPTTLTRIDLSATAIGSLLPTDTARMANVVELYLEDMPELQSIALDALKPLQAVKRISFQNSRRLSAIDAQAFGVNASKWPPLEAMIFRGTDMRRFNATLLPVFAKLAELDLNGVPLRCDCELIWLKQLTLETNGRCLKPSRLRGMLLSNVHAADLTCDTWPRWLSGLIILALIGLFSAGIYLVVMGLRPHRGVTLRNKVGAGSPYARITIEPNRQENPNQST